NSVRAIQCPDRNVHFAVCQRIGSVAATVATERMLGALSDEFLPGEPHKCIVANGDLTRRTSARSLPTERAMAHADLRISANDSETDAFAEAAAVHHVASPFSDNSPSMIVPMVVEQAGWVLRMLPYPHLRPLPLTIDKNTIEKRFGAKFLRASCLQCSVKLGHLFEQLCGF